MFIETGPRAMPSSVGAACRRLHNLFNRPENVFFIVLNFEAPEKLEILFPKGCSGMMLFLIRDVSDNVIQL